jgi:hypothetical protein
MQVRACDPHAITLEASTATSVPIVKSTVLQELDAQGYFIGEARFVRNQAADSAAEVTFVVTIQKRNAE